MDVFRPDCGRFRHGPIMAALSFAAECMGACPPCRRCGTAKVRGAANECARNAQFTAVRKGKDKIRCCGCFRRGAENAGSVFSGLFRASCRYGREAEVCGTFFPSGSGCPGRMPRNGKGAV